MNKLPWRKRTVTVIGLSFLLTLVLSPSHTSTLADPGLGNYVFLFAFGHVRPPGWFDTPADVAIDTDGNVYVVDRHRIHKFDSSGNPITVWGGYGDGDGQFRYPEGVAVDGTGCVYVADTSNNRVQKLTGDGTPVTEWGSYGDADGDFKSPTGIALDLSGNVYVVDKAPPGK